MNKGENSVFYTIGTYIQKENNKQKKTRSKTYPRDSVPNICKLPKVVLVLVLVTFPIST